MCTVDAVWCRISDIAGGLTDALIVDGGGYEGVRRGGSLAAGHQVTERERDMGLGCTGLELRHLLFSKELKAEFQHIRDTINDQELRVYSIADLTPGLDQASQPRTNVVVDHELVKGNANKSDVANMNNIDSDNFGR